MPDRYVRRKSLKRLDTMRDVNLDAARQQGRVLLKRRIRAVAILLAAALLTAALAA